MANMAYCRFQNTAQDLKDCYDHLWDDGLSPEEERAKRRLVKLCKNISDDTEGEEKDGQ